MTLLLLWEEYRAAEPDGYAYSRWCELYRAWEGRLSPTMRQAHPAGERLFVDYAGQTVAIVDGRTGEARSAQVFVATLGASSYTYAEATWTQSLPDWIGSHTRALAFLGGVPAQLVPDNPKVGVDRANWYEPGLNRTYLDMATHYGTAILPTRVRKPRDKAKVEVAVLVVERWILARLRHRRFFSLAELNEAIAGLVTDLNARPMRRLGVSRRDLFLELDRPALKPLPPAAYEYAEWRLRRVSLDYHVDIDGHYYSVPYRLIRDQVEARPTARTVELFHNGERVAAHLRGVGAAGTPPCRSTCRARTDGMPSGRSRLIGRTPASARVRPACRPLLDADRTPSRATAPVSVSCAWRQLLARALAIKPHQILGGRRLDRRSPQPCGQHLPIAFAAVAPDDAAQRRIGLHRRGVHADPPPLTSPCSATRRSTQANIPVWTSSGSRQRVRLIQLWSAPARVVPSRRNSRSDRLSAQRHSIPRSQSMPLEIADQQHPEVSAGR